MVQRSLSSLLTVLLVALCFSVSAVASEKAVLTGKLNINTASVSELERLPFIGPKKAEKIATYRAGHPFKKPEEIMNVKGIGSGIYKKIEKYLVVSGDNTLK